MAKFCINCRHFVSMHTGFVCWRVIGDVSLVTGEPAMLDRPCGHERADPTGCGPDAKYFEELWP